MIADAFARTAMILGAEAMEALSRSRVAVVGLGGVGSWAAEALARSGVGGFLLVDDDSVSATNLNRQVIATLGSLGRPKVEAMAERILSINPGAAIESRAERLDAGSAERLIGPGLSYVVDAIDSVSCKVELAVRARSLGLPVVSVLGTGGKLDPTRLEVADISETSVCPLARAVRKELRRRGVESLQVVYSREEPTGEVVDAPAAGAAAGASGAGASGAGRRSVPGSACFVPPAAGLVAASIVVRGITAPYRRPSP